MSADDENREIGLDQAAPGMTLAAALLDMHGAVLLPQQATLTEATLAALRRRGVERCVVRVEAEAVDPALRARERERQLLRLRHLFRHSSASGGGALLLLRLCAYRERKLP